MNSLLVDFIIEARELLESVGANLLELELDPGNENLLALSFRAFHTLKGDSGLFDFLPITEVLHAAEDQLGALREGRLELSHELVDSLLAAGDQIGKWLVDIEKTEGLPPDAPATAERLARRLKSVSGQQEVVPDQLREPGAMVADLTVFADIARRETAVLAMRSGDVATFVRYRCDEDCFFRGEDPLFAVQQLEPRMVRIETPETWPELAELDPYRCFLSFTIVTTLAREEVEHRLRYVRDQVEIVDLAARDLWAQTASEIDLVPLGLTMHERSIVSAWVTKPEPHEVHWALSDPVLRLLQEQVLALQTPGKPELLAGRLRSCATLLTRAMRLGAQETAELDATLVACLNEVSPTSLLEWINARLQSPVEAGEGFASPKVAPETRERETEPQSSIKTLKVDQGRIDRIMSLIGEMVVAKNSLPYLSERADRTFGVRELSREIKDHYAIINRITQEMQDAIMEVRMLPVAHVLQRFPRLVRDLSRKLGKKIDMVTEGEETEADKTVIEALGDPLLHIIRNSLDHGIETLEERKRVGKPETGTIRVKASQDNGRVLIVVSDDGKGIDPQRIKEKARAQGILDDERYETITDREAIQLVFHAGLSTAETITDVSGRGVGMDVVLNAIQQVRGTVQISSELGKGTTVEIALPMTMATSQVMVIEAGGQRFGVPVQIVLETVRVPTASIFRFKDRELIVLRNQTIPLARLGRLLSLRQVKESTGETSVLVVRHRGESVGIVVDDFHTNVEVILRPVEGILAGLKGFSSSAVLGDGTVLLILDLQELI